MGSPFPPLGHLPSQGSEHRAHLHWQVDSLQNTESPGSHELSYTILLIYYLYYAMAIYTPLSGLGCTDQRKSANTVFVKLPSWQHDELLSALKLPMSAGNAPKIS